MLKHVTYTFMLIVGLASFAQSDFRFKNFTINDGLSQSSVTCILQDDLYSLWIGTQDGLNRFDGKSFEVFTADNTQGLNSGYIKCSQRDDQGRLWFGTNNGLSVYNPKTEQFKTFSPSDKATLQIEDISIDADGTIWLASTESGVYKFDSKNETFRSIKDIIPSIKATNVFLTNKGQLVVATGDKGVFLCNTHQMKAEKLSFDGGSRNFPHVNTIVQEGDNLVIGTNQGLFTIVLKSKKIVPLFLNLNKKHGDLNVSAVYRDEEVGWFVATKSNGLFTIFDNGTIMHSEEDIFQKDALLFNQLNNIYSDKSGTIWIGSQRGLTCFDPSYKGFMGVGPSGNEARGIPSPGVWSFTESPDGNYIFIGTDNGISRYNKTAGVYEQYIRKKPGTTQETDEMAVLAMKSITKDKILVGCADGLYELSIKGTNFAYKQIKTSQNKKGSQVKHLRIYSIAHWKNDKYFIATKDGVILYDASNGKTEEFTHDPLNPKKSLSVGICRLAFKDSKNRVWFATSTGGLNLMQQEQGQIVIVPYQYNTIIKSVSIDYITSIHEDKNGVFWMGTLGSGLLKWDEKNKRIESYNKKDGLPNDVIYGVLSDELDNLWFSTNKGLCLFNPTKKIIRNYTEVDGLLSNEFNLGAYVKSSSGRLYFGGIYGYNHFKPADITNKTKDIKVVFTKLKLENNWIKPDNRKEAVLKKAVYLSESIELTYKQRSFTLKFQPSVLNKSERLNYKYILEGSDEGEILIGSNNEIHFNALSPGDYVLKVYARIGDGKWSKNPAVMNLIIRPPFWSTWWFWMVMAILFAFAIRLFVRQRTAAARREKLKLELKIRERTREIQKQNEKIEKQKRKIEEERNKVIKQQQLLQIEKDKTEKLLRNVIPESTAEELKKRGRARARAYRTVSVIFTDFVGFTKISDRMNPTELVKRLDVFFTKFDEIIVKNNLEKIKTIGDAYMCAGGVPVRNNTNPIDACLAAVQIQAYMQEHKGSAIAKNEEFWELRLGINTGEVTAGVIGSERLAYDIWGATVNQAQRMEMLGESGKVTITGATFNHIEPYFECSFKGKAQTKSRGIIDMYVVERIKPELSIRGEGIFPNERFNQIVNLHHYSSINYYKAERHIMKLLEQHLSSKLYYHSINHTKDVVSAVEHLALVENVTDEGLFLLKSAATYHDAGFIEKYENNEPVGARLAEEILPKYGYTDKHIEEIKRLIYVTQIPHDPKTKLEEIICDADLDYLGRDDFHEISDKLKRELMDHGKIESDKQWDEIQVDFLTNHRYFTQTAIKTRKVKKEQNLQEVVDRLARNDYQKSKKG